MGHPGPQAHQAEAGHAQAENGRYLLRAPGAHQQQKSHQAQDAAHGLLHPDQQTLPPGRVRDPAQQLRAAARPVGRPLPGFKINGFHR